MDSLEYQRHENRRVRDAFYRIIAPWMRHRFHGREIVLGDDLRRRRHNIRLLIGRGVIEEIKPEDTISEKPKRSAAKNWRKE